MGFMIKPIFVFIIIAVVLAAVWFLFLRDRSQEGPQTIGDDKILVVMETVRGNVELELYPKVAPETVLNFISLSQKGFYDGTKFHRVVPEFVIQGGDPVGNGTGGPGYKFEDEPVTLKYDRGIVAMANSGPDTNGSQFFIMLADTPLPPNYTIFGKVTTGMEVVDKIQVGDTMNKVIIEPLK